ncbi:hypothetical protein OsccyDRAFT_2792 [Leptolyngbyaceae cyanobacterium JSC-12]|nr:hypothetical protein OsccyDRAFT_2792 [Leptolyngbyaceae cyanobacterium JSC-12]
MLLHQRSHLFPTLVASVSLFTSAIAPLTLPLQTIAAPAPITVAQLFPNSSPARNVTLPRGTRIPTYYARAEKIVIAPNETVPLTLTVSRNLRLSNGTVLIPAGSQVTGKIQPVRDGAQFVADTLILPDGTRSPLNARSDVINTRQEVQPGVNGDALIKGSAIGAGAAAILSGILGNRRITLGRVLLGAGAGAAGGLIFGKRKAEVIVIDSKSDLVLTLDSSLTFSRTYY